MKKFTKLSLIASSAILGTALLTGCGSNGTASSSSSSTTVDQTPSDGYFAKVISQKSDGTTKSDENKTKYTFDKLSNGTTKLLPGSYIDVDNSGDLNTSVDKELKFEMKSIASATVMTPLTSIVVEKAVKSGTTDFSSETELKIGNLDVATFDPIKTLQSGTLSDEIINAIKLNKTIAAIAQESSGSASMKDLSALSDVNISATSFDLNNSVQNAGIDSTLLTIAETAAKDATSFVTLVKEARDNGVDVKNLVASFDDKDKFYEEANNAVTSIQETNSSYTSTILTDINDSKTAYSTAAAALPARLFTGSQFSLGDQNVSLVSGTFSHEITTEENASVADFYNIAFKGATVSKAVSATDANLSIKVSTENNQSVCLTISGAQIKSADDNKSVVVTLPTNATITAKQQNLPALQDVIGTSVSGTLNSEMVNTDLSFNLETLLDNTSSSKITDAVEALDAYLAKSSEYDVNITIELASTLKTDYTSITGTVMANMTAEAIAAANTAKITAAKAYLLDYSISTSTTSLPTSYNGTTISYLDSSDTDVIANDGTVTLPSEDTNVTLKATITAGDETYTLGSSQDWTLTVPAMTQTVCEGLGGTWTSVPGTPASCSL
jgi:hypothetical protein